MYTRKPKSIVSKVIDLTTGLQSREAAHTWMAGDTTRSARFGSTSRETFSERRQIDRTRSTVGRYNDSSIAHNATAARGDLTKAARLQREKINQRFGDDTTDVGDNTISNPIPPQASPQIQDTNSTFYPDFRSKL